MRRTINTQLRVPAEDRFLPLVQAHVRDLALTIGFPKKDVLNLELAAEEAFQNICTHAYPDGSPGDMLVNGELLESELRLEFMDEGLPFDPALLVPRTEQSGNESSGLGLKLIHHAVDEVRWVNRGRKGKAMCLVKQLPLAGAEAGDRFVSVAQPAVHFDGEINSGKAADRRQPSEQHYEIRPLRPDEALQVARLFWLTYGYSYKNEAFYRPEGIVDLVSRGILHSYVAVTRNGEVVGHAGLLRPEPVPMAEMALLAISPAHRGGGLMKRFFSTLSEQAQKMDLFGISLNPVTSHPVSQRNVIAMGTRPCGLDLAACPPRLFKAMNLEDGPTHRESYLHCFLYLGTPPPAASNIPERHRDITRRIYENLGRRLTPAKASDPLAPGKEAQEKPGREGAYSVSFDAGLSKGAVRVSVADERQWPEILRAATDLMDIAGAEVVHMDLPLAQSATPLICLKAEAAGFFFAGVWPHAAEDGDILRLSRLAVPLDMSLLRLHPGFAGELAQYVGAGMSRAMGT